MPTTVETVATYGGATPTRDMDHEIFDAAVAAFLAFVKNLAPDFNTSIGQINTVAGEMNGYAISADADATAAAGSATAAAASANAAAYSGSTTYNYPDTAIGSDGGTYRCMGTSVLGDDPVTSTTGNWINITVVAGPLAPNRPKFISYTSDTQIDLTGPAAYHLHGIGRVWWTGTLVYDFTTLAASTASYLYIDKSTITAQGPITASNLIDSTTAPTYDAAKGGWYNGDDLCIMGVMGLGATSYIPFEHDGGRQIWYASQIVEQSGVAITTGGANYALTVPGFVTRAGINLQLLYTSAATVAYMRKGGTTVTGHGMGWVTSNITIDTVRGEVALNSSRQLNIYGSAAGADFTFRTDYFYLPKGM